MQWKNVREFKQGSRLSHFKKLYGHPVICTGNTMYYNGVLVKKKEFIG